MIVFVKTNDIINYIKLDTCTIIIVMKIEDSDWDMPLGKGTAHCSQR